MAAAPKHWKVEILDSNSSIHAQLALANQAAKNEAMMNPGKTVVVYQAVSCAWINSAPIVLQEIK